MTDKYTRRDFSDFSIEKKEKPKAYAPPAERDTACAEVTYGGSDSGASFRIPSRSADAGASHAPVKKFRTQDYSRRGADYSAVKKKSPPPGKAEERVLFEYRGSGYVRYISVKSWRSSYTFYDKFVKDALISHEQKGVKSPRVPFFAYIPQYTQLTTGAYAFYQYMKEQIRQGVRLNDVDFSYVLLYIYEIINLPGVIPPEEGAELLARTWILYRPMHPSLDKYMCEWVPDYCLVNKVPLPEMLRPYVTELGAKSGIKEFFADTALAWGLPMGKMVRLALSDYVPGKSRSTRDIPNFVRQVEEVFDEVVSEQARAGVGVFDPSLCREVKVTRDAYCGSLCAENAKKRMTVEFFTFFRSPEARRMVTELMKGCENIVRARHGIKARLAVPPVKGISAVISAKTTEEAEYLKLYEAPSEPLSPEAALEIERSSWQNVFTLTDVAEDFTADEDVPEGALTTEDILPDEAVAEDAASPEEVPAEAPQAEPKPHVDNVPVPLTEYDFPDDFPSAIRTEPQLIEALRAVMSGGSFADRCRELGLFAPDAARRINEMAMDTLGDVILEPDGADFAFVEEYREDVAL